MVESMYIRSTDKSEDIQHRTEGYEGRFVSSPNHAGKTHIVIFGDYIPNVRHIHLY